MTERPRIFLDTSVLKLAADRIIRGFSRTTMVKWGDKEFTAPVTQWHEVPKVPRPGTEQASDAALLPLVAQLAIHGRIELLWHLDGLLEFAGLPNTDSPRGRFFGAPITWTQPPSVGRRIVADGQKSMSEHQLDFLLSRRDQRFLDLQIAVGAKIGASNFRNQLLDAWHIWCAETIGADCFLTCDYKLIHVTMHSRLRPEVAIITPRVLLGDLLHSRKISILDLVRAAGAEVWRRARKRPVVGLQDRVLLGERLDRLGYYD